MNRILLSVVLLLAVAPRALAHFTFVVPQPGGVKANVILSEDLKPDGDVDVSIVAGAKLVARDASGRQTSLTLEKAADALAVTLPGDTRVVHGIVDLGVRERRNVEPHRLIYHPKTIVGDAFDPKATLGAAVPIEIIPDGTPGAVTFRVETGGKPAAGVDVRVIFPDGSQKTVATGADGRTPPFEPRGRYGAWAKVIEAVGGERDGRKFTQTRHYATLVADVAAAPTTRPAASTRPVGKFLPLPEATSSFGAVAVDGWLYVYGGHVAPTHVYHTAAVSGRFHRLNLADPKTWEELPGGPALQGMNLAAHNGKIYRIGGMQPKNPTGEKADNFSIVDCARFDPETKKWVDLPPLPSPRSSHDVVVIGDRLYVVGGWNLRGRGKRPEWPDTLHAMDLASPRPVWSSIAQPFQRRALIAAVHDGKLVVLGGFDENDDPTRCVDVYDPKANAWAAAPSLPGRPQNGFAPAACTHDGRLYASVGDGTLHRLGDGGKDWDLVATATPRIAHRIAPNGPAILILGGAAKGDNMNLVETVAPAPPQASAANAK